MSIKKMRISVFSLFRNSEPYLKKCLSQLESLELSTDADFSYFFYENDSTDNTVSILKSWIKNKKGRLLSETLGKKKFGSTLDPERMILMSEIRNKMKSICEIETDYSLIFDSDITFKSNTVNQFLKFNNLDHCDYPNYSMLTSNIRQDVPCKMGSGKQDSYYDSSCLFDLNKTNCMTWSDNPFYETSDRDNFENNLPIEIYRGFGSMAFLPSPLLHKVKWQSNGESEHWSFCDQLRKFDPIYFIPTVKPKVKINQKKWEHEDKVISHQKWMLENKWNRFLWKTKSKKL